MKRRNADVSKLRRPVKRGRITENIYGSTFLYLKFILVWAIVLLADYLLEFRFEYLWPLWLLFRSVYDSFKYQGLAFSVFFVCMAFTSDMFCLLFIPIHWLFFAASTYVWVQYVWHTEKGVCLPTVSLWLLFVYIEASVRLKELRNMPFHLDLCRPFAAHCIGYPVVTLGFGFKSYISYKLRLRKQKDIAKENEFYLQLLQQALPQLQKTPVLNSSKSDSDLLRANGSAVSMAVTGGSCSNGAIPSSVVSSTSSPTTLTTTTTNSKQQQQQHHSHSKSFSGVESLSPATTGGGQLGRSTRDHSSGSSTCSSHSGGQRSGKMMSSSSSSTTTTSTTMMTTTTTTTSHMNNVETLQPNNKTNHDIDYIELNLPRSHGQSVNDYTGSRENLTAVEHSVKSLKNNNTTSTTSSSSTSNDRSGSGGQGSRPHRINGTVVKDNVKSKDKQGVLSSRITQPNNNKDKSNVDITVNVVSPHQKDDNTIRLESDIKRLKADLQASRQLEQDLRNQINTLVADEKNVRAELQQLRQDNETLQHKLHNLVTQKQQDKRTISELEKKVRAEKDSKAAIEKQLQDERIKKKSDEAMAAKALAIANASRNECTESCKARRRDLETDLKQVKWEVKQREEKMKHMECEVQDLRQNGVNHMEMGTLMSALSAMKDKNSHLEKSLSAENRLKLDLFSALGDARRQNEIQQSLLAQKDKEINEMKSKIAEVMAVMPPTSLSSAHHSLHGGGPFSTASFLDNAQSGLDPNAAAYHPKDLDAWHDWNRSLAD